MKKSKYKKHLAKLQIELAHLQAKDAMFDHTDTAQSPWFVVDADDKKAARLNCIDHLLSQIDYHPVKHPEITLAEIDRKNYQRPPHKQQKHIPQKFG